MSFEATSKTSYLFLYVKIIYPFACEDATRAGLA